MKKLKVVLALLLVAALCLAMFAACAKTETPAKTDEPAKTDTTPAKEDTPAKTEEPAETNEPETYEPEDIVDIDIYVVEFTGTCTQFERVQEAINAICGPEIGVNVKLQIFPFGDYATKIGLMAASGENIDLAYLSFGAAGYSSMYTSNQLMDIKPYLSEYAPGLVETMGDYINTYAISGGIYALPPYRAYNSQGYLLMRKDMLEEMGKLDFARNMTSWAEVESIFDQVKKDYPEIWPVNGFGCQDLIMCGDRFEDAVSYDRLGDALYVLMTDPENNKVLSYLESEEYLSQVHRAADWFNKGYVWPDVLINTELGDNLIRQNVIFSEFMPSEYGVESAKTQATGYDIVAVEIKPLMVCSAHTQKFGICVPSIADEPVAAVKFLEKMYTDKRIIMLLTYGEEGVDYVVTETGEVDFPDGVESGTVGYHSHDFMVGNQFLITPWKGAGADQREKAMEGFLVAPPSPYLGFTFDSTGYDNIIASLTSVTDEYSRSMINFEQARYEEYISKLKKAGLEDYIAAFQTQLDAWLAAK